MSVEVVAPWLLAAILALVRRPGPARFAAVALLTAAAAYGGQPEVLACLAYVGVGWGALLVVARGAVEAACWPSSPGAAALRRAAGGAADRADARVPADRGRLPRRAARPHAPRAVGLDALVRRKGLQPELLGWPLALVAVAGAIGWRRRIAGAGSCCVAAGVWALRSFDTPLASLLSWLPGLDRVNVPRYGEFVLGLAAAALAAAALARISRPAAGAGRRSRRWWSRRCGCCTRRGSSRFRSTRIRPLPSLAAVRRDLSRGSGWRRSGATCGRRSRRRSRSPTRGPRTRSTRSATRGWWRCAAAAPGSASCSPRRSETAGLDLVDAVGVRYVAASPGSAAPAGMQPVQTLPKDLAVFANPDAYPHAFTPAAVTFAALGGRGGRRAAGTERLRDRSVIEQPTDAMRAATGTATVIVDARSAGTRERLQVTADAAAVVVVASQVFPGWEATVDGQADADPARQPRDARDRGARRNARGGVPVPARFVPARARCWASRAWLVLPAAVSRRLRAAAREAERSGGAAWRAGTGGLRRSDGHSHRFCNISTSLTKRKGGVEGRRYTHCNRTARNAEREPPDTANGPRRGATSAGSWVVPSQGG